MGFSLLCLPLNIDYYRDIKSANVLMSQNNKNRNQWTQLISKFSKCLKKNAIEALEGIPFYFSPELWYLFNN